MREAVVKEKDIIELDFLTRVSKAMEEKGMTTTALRFAPPNGRIASTSRSASSASASEKASPKKNSSPKAAAAIITKPFPKTRANRATPRS